MVNHTPGPWRKGSNGAVIFDNPNADPLVVEYYGGDVIGETIHDDNMDLIAAAPDLYEACKELKTALQIAIMARFGDLDRATDNQKIILANARAAIGKAEGHAP